MAVYKQPRSNNWWYKFVWNGDLIRQTTKQTNKRVAEQMEAAHRTALAKGEVGIREKKPVPTLEDFADRAFLPFVRATSAAKPRTITFYENSVQNLKACAKLSSLSLDKITTDVIAAFVAHRRTKHLEVSTINRDLATLRRMFHLAQEWGIVSTLLPKVRMLPGENRRERILNPDEEAIYLKAATWIGQRIEQAYREALEGIRATVRGEQPQKPDAYLLRDVACVLIDCGLRPEEFFRLGMVPLRFIKERDEVPAVEFPHLNGCYRSWKCAVRLQHQIGCFQPQRKVLTSKLPASKSITPKQSPWQARSCARKVVEKTPSSNRSFYTRSDTLA